MLKLHGFPLSNYYNVVKAALLEKALPFTEVEASSDDPEYRNLSPMGKVPCLETEQGAFSETQVMLDYLEEVKPEPRLYPVGAFERAKVRELMRIIELYLELPARRLYPQAFFGGQVSDEIKDSVRPELEKGVDALRQAAAFDPYIGGEAFGYADLAAVMHLRLVSGAAKAVYGEDPLQRIEGLGDYLKRIGERPSVQQVMADYKASVKVLMSKMQGGG